MGKAKDTSSTKRAQIMALYEENLSHSAIAKRLGIAKSTVTCTIARFKELKSYKSRSRPGRPRVTSPCTDKKIRCGESYVVIQASGHSAEDSC